MMPESHQRLKPILLLVIGSIAILGGAAAAYHVSRNHYTVYAGDEVLSVSGNYHSVGDVLAAAGVTVRVEDFVAPPLNEAAVPGTAIQVQRAQAVTVHSDAGSQVIWTRQPNLGAFLAENGITVRRTDQVFADSVPIAFNALDETGLPAVLEISRFLTVTVHNGNQQLVLRTSKQTVGEVLAEAGITIYAADGVEPPMGSWLVPDMAIHVRHSAPVSIRVDGRLVNTRSHHGRVADILAEAGIGLVGLDYTRPALEATVQTGDTIEIIRVTEDFRIEDRPIPYQTLWQPSDQLELDSRALLSAGVPGILRQRIRVRYENGVEVSQAADGEWVAREPVNEVIGYGTRINVRILETAEGAYEYWRVVRMRVTSYTAASSGKPPDHPAYGVTASGIQAGTGIVAIDRSVVPFRSWVYVPGYGVGYAGDTGGGVRGRWIDLGYHSHDYVSWSGYVDVYYLTPVPPPDRINYLVPANLP